MFGKLKKHKLQTLKKNLFQVLFYSDHRGDLFDNRYLSNH